MVRAICIVLVGLATGFSATPLSWGTSWDGEGLGMNLTPGPVYRTGSGLTPNHLGANLWYHLEPDLVGVTGMELGSWNPDRSTSRFRAQYTGAFVLVSPSQDSLSALELSLRLGGERQSTVLDTLADAPARASQSWDWQAGLRAGYTWQKPGIGGWFSWGPLLSWRTSGDAPGLRWMLEAEAGAAIDLRPWWNGSKEITRTWSLVIRLPFRLDPMAPRLRDHDLVEEREWSAGILIGPSVLF